MLSPLRQVNFAQQLPFRDVNVHVLYVIWEFEPVARGDRHALLSRSTPTPDHLAAKETVRRVAPKGLTHRSALQSQLPSTPTYQLARNG